MGLGRSPALDQTRASFPVLTKPHLIPHLIDPLTQLERWLPPPGNRTTKGQFDPRVHGYTGNVGTSLSWMPPSEHDKRAERNAELQKEFPMVLDYNSGTPIGTGAFTLRVLCSFSLCRISLADSLSWCDLGRVYPEHSWERGKEQRSEVIFGSERPSETELEYLGEHVHHPGLAPAQQRRVKQHRIGFTYS